MKLRAGPRRSGHRRRHPDPSARFDTLEPRIVLSNTYYAWTDVTMLPGYDPSTARLDVGDDRLSGGSENGRFLWSSACEDPTNVYNYWIPYMVSNGEVLYPHKVPGLADAALPWTNSNGVVFGIGYAGDDTGRLFTYDLFGDGERAYLDEAGLTAPGDFALGNAWPVAIGDSGALVVRTRVAEGELEELWIITDNVVRHLWTGRFVDINDSNEVVGYNFDETQEPGGSYENYQPMYWAPGIGEATNLSTMNITGVSDIGAAGEMLVDYGSVTIRGREWEPVPEMVVLWNDGVVTDLGLGYEYDDATGDEVWYTARSHDEAGRFMVERHRYIASTGSIINFGEVVRAIDGEIRFLSDNVYFGDDSHFLSPGQIVGFGTGWWETVDPADLGAVEPGGPVVLWQSSPGSIDTWSLTPGGRGLELRQDLIDRSVTPLLRDLRAVGEAGARWEVLTYPASEESVLVVYASEGVTYESLRTGSPLVHGWPKRTPDDAVIWSATSYLRQDGRAVLAYLDEAGKLSVGYDSYKFSNLSHHFAQWGRSAPSFVGQLAAYSTEWHGQTIVGLDTNGDVQAAWWSPGLRSPYWTVSNLSEITGAPPLVGRVVGGGYGKDGMVILGTDASGHLISLVWTAEAGDWTVTDLTLDAGGPALTSDSLQLQGPLGQLSILAKDESGDIVSFSWYGVDRLQMVSVTEAVGGDAPELVGPISYHTPVIGYQYIGGTTADGQMILFSHLPDGDGGYSWDWQDLTALVEW